MLLVLFVILGPYLFEELVRQFAGGVINIPNKKDPDYFGRDREIVN